MLNKKFNFLKFCHYIRWKNYKKNNCRSLPIMAHSLYLWIKNAYWNSWWMRNNYVRSCVIFPVLSKNYLFPIAQVQHFLKIYLIFSIWERKQKRHIFYIVFKNVRFYSIFQNIKIIYKSRYWKFSCIYSKKVYSPPPLNKYIYVRTYIN